MIDLLSFFLSLIPPTLLPPALVLHWLSLQVQKNLCSSCASVFGVWENHSLHWVTLVQKKVKVFTGTSLVRWWVKVCTGSLLHQEVSEDPHRDCHSITCTVQVILSRKVERVLDYGIYIKLAWIVLKRDNKESFKSRGIWLRKFVYSQSCSSWKE